MSAISESAKEEFLSFKFEYDSVSQAIKLAKGKGDIGALDADIQELIKTKDTMKRRYQTFMENFVKKMPLSSNVLSLGEGWYGVRYLDHNLNRALKIDLIEGDKVLSVIHRDGRYDEEFSKAALDSLVPSVVDMDALEKYKGRIAINALKYIREYCGVTLEPPAEETIGQVSEEGIGVTHHAGKRWVQRVIGIANDASAVEYKRQHLEEVEKAVLDGFNSAEHLWSDPEEDYEFYFDPNNMMYVVGNQESGSKSIVTVWESDFTFTKGINRAIVLEQIKVIDKCWWDLKDTIDCHEDLKEDVQEGIRQVNDEIGALTAQIELLKAKRNTLTAQLDESSKVLNKAQVDYKVQYDKLFKKFDM